MTRDLPSLHLLRVFEAAGRHGSFKRAAEELHVTPSAVSHQIKALEEQLGFALFHRGNRSLTLTDSGREYLGVVDSAFRELREGTARVLRRQRGATLTISMLPGLDRELVLPRLAAFQARVPGVMLRIETSEELADLRHGEADLAVRYGAGRWPGTQSEKLLDLESTPVCSPRFAEANRIDDLRALERLPLIHMSFFPDAWGLWSRAAGLARFTPREALWLDSYAACIDACEQGLGLALGLLPLEQRRIDAGRLVAPFEVRLPNPRGLHLVYRPGDGEREEIRAFRDWLLEQLERA
ncbi:MAG: transcriptional regulator GcvA [Burkholderiales bacterium]|nr:transcriptional regulator GcvA [Burkholderiales bacterium]